jgi:signal transduction histidine kinase/ActR/RegA family two-component response regulator/HPt (histidine-containing phosphotransfer) domain-containing protein
VTSPDVPNAVLPVEDDAETAEKEAQRRLRESEMFLQHVEKVSGVGGFMIDLASGTQHWTRQSYRIHEVDETNEHALEMDAFLSPEVRAQVQESTRPDGTATGYDIEAPIVTAAGRSIWIRTVGEVERIQGVAVRVVGAIQDITERRIMESRLRDATTAAEKASKAKSEFLANMSHEIRTPLNAVIGLGYLLEQTTLNEDQRQFLSKIQLSGRALLSVVNNVLDLSKIEAGEMSLEYQTFDLRELVRDLVQMLAPQAEAKGIGLIVQTSSDLPPLMIGDVSRLRQILTNLLNNSIKFTEQGEVDLSVSCTESASDRIRLRCVVRDSGIGIDAVALGRLFTPFTQADASTTRRFGGTGLGLSIARRLVELMGGEIGVTSTVEVGSTFWIEIPMQIACDSAGTVGTDAAPGVQILIADSIGKGLHGLADVEYTANLHAKWLVGVHVLVVDDSDINLEVAQGILERQGATVKACSDAGAALEYVRTHHRQLDLVLMDVQMPILDGNEATRRIREEHELRSLPIVALTAGALVGERQRALDAGMNDFISKPFEPQTLIRMVRRLIEQARGALIPIVPLDSEPKSTEVPTNMSSIDFDIVQRVFGDDLPLFKSLLTRFVRDYADLAIPITVSPDSQSARRSLEARAHKLKGSAGMLGAIRVMRLASTAEAGLRNDRPASALGPMLKQLAAALTVLREEAESFLRSPTERGANSTNEVGDCTSEGPADLDELCALLESQNLAAIDKFGTVSTKLRGMLDAARFDRLTSAIDCLDFQAGAAILREARLVGVA